MIEQVIAMQEFLDHVLFTINGWTLDVAQLIMCLFVFGLFIFFFRFLAKPSAIGQFLEKNNIEQSNRRKFHWTMRLLLFFLGVLLLLLILGINVTLYTRNNFNLTLTLILEGLIILQAARLMDWIFGNILVHKYYRKRDAPKPKRFEDSRNIEEKSAIRIGQTIVYIAAIYVLMSGLNLDFSLFTYTVSNDGNPSTIDFRFTKILSGLLILLVARLVLWIITEIFLYGVYNRRGIDPGSRFAFNQLIKYFVYVIAIFVALDHVGINMTLIWTGAAALLVGIGLGLQQTFNDFISGVVLLFERTTSVGDILEFGDKVGTVKKIGLRASTLETRYNKSVVVPNSKLVNDNVINWSHYHNRVRFEVAIGVAYGSDTAKVKDILINAAAGHKEVLKFPAPFVRFSSFGNSSLDFVLSFFSRNYLLIEDVKSDLRFEIDNRFREEGITIPFPQMDIWYRNQPKSKS
jgi:small-conductance mechanosensitive channel